MRVATDLVLSHSSSFDPEQRRLWWKHLALQTVRLYSRKQYWLHKELTGEVGREQCMQDCVGISTTYR